MPNEEDKRDDEGPDDDDPRAGDARDERDKDKSIRQRLEGIVPDLVKRTFYAGLGAVFTTEEGIRKIANEFSLPKDVASYLINSAQSTKDELFRIVGREVREFLQNLNVGGEVAKLLTQLSFEIKTEIRFIPNEEAVGKVKPDMKYKVSLKRAKTDGGADSTEAGEDDKPEKPEKK
jgi:hypothetical protein